MKTAAASVLLVESAHPVLRAYRATLMAAGIEVLVALTAAEALHLLTTRRPSVAVLDLMLPDRDGLQLMGEMLALNPELCVLVTSGQGSLDRAVASMRAGAFDYLLKPIDEKRLLSSVQAALDITNTGPTTAAPRRNRPRSDLEEQAEQVASIGTSEAMKSVHRVIASAAPSIATVFITGESGTGKELAAQALHAQSRRKNGPFIALNCGAIPHDLLESEVFGHMKGSFTGAIADKPGAAGAADGGTLFLDEVCEMAPALQTKLLRFLQTSMVQPIGATRPRRVDVRIICATNQDPLEAIRRHRFREDLYYRLHVVPLHMPPLRARGQDVVEIAEVALQRFGLEEGKSFPGLAPATRQILLAYDWPGNVRQLLNILRQVAVMNPGGLVTPEMLPADLHRSSGRAGLAPPGLIAPGAASAAATSAEVFQRGPLTGLSLAAIERLAIEAALVRHQGSVPKAAHELQISIATLYRRMEAWRKAVEAAEPGSAG